MQFKYPEILYALLLLLIPIFIHLFQLRRFEKIAFTNVAFLKKVVLQTRKSSKLKKFLILLSRLGLFTALIIAFAQPFFSNSKQGLKPRTILYLDNSLSMQAKNGTDELFKSAIQDVISNYKSDANLTILTNNDVFSDLNDKELKNQLLSLDYSPFSKEINTVLLQANRIFKADKEYKNNMVLVSDFQSDIVKEKMPLDNDIQYSFVQLLPQEKQNLSIDSVYIAKQDGLNISLNVELSSYNVAADNLSVSLFKNDILVGKTSVSLNINTSKTANFKLPFTDSFNGKIVIEDNFIAFDNELYFSLNKLEKINVLAIGETNKFLTKIYTKPEFNLISKKLNQLDYDVVGNQHLIILNELSIIPITLQKPLRKFVVNGGSLVVIPSVKANINSYNQLFSTLRIGSINKKVATELQVNNINFSHPILDNVFEKKIKNFQYPTVKSFYESLFKNQKFILKLNNQKGFISEIKVNNGKIFWIASSINQSNSNFKSSPLIVPVFYNFGKQSHKLTELYYTIGKENTVNVNTSVTADQVLSISQLNSNKKSLSFIPLQQVLQQKVVLTLVDNPKKEGFYKITKKNKSLKNIAFNYDRVEGKVQYSDLKASLKQYDNVVYSNNIMETFGNIDAQFKVDQYWKWLIALALLFLIIEMLLVKFLKN